MVDSEEIYDILRWVEIKKFETKDVYDYDMLDKIETIIGSINDTQEE